MRAATVAEPHTVEDGAYLVPLRLFIGLGWLRACAEKVIDPGWRDGSSLTAFLGHHLAAGEAAFPWYEILIEQVFLPHAMALALVILLGQFFAGAAIAAGLLTNAALLGGLFMNLNFLLAGEPNPSTFYIVIQVALLLTHAGAILGLDAGLSKTIRNPLLVAQPLTVRQRSRQRVPVLPIGALALITAVYAITHVTDWSPAGSVDDPAMIVAILALLSLAWMTIAWLRQASGGGRMLHRQELPSRTRPRVDLPDCVGVPRLRLAGAVAAGRARETNPGAWLRGSLLLPGARSLAILALAALVATTAVIERGALAKRDASPASAQEPSVIQAMPFAATPGAESPRVATAATLPESVISMTESPVAAPGTTQPTLEVPQPIPGTAGLAAGNVVIVTVDGLNLRTEPALNGDVTVVLPAGWQAPVVDGPTVADGFSWYQLDVDGVTGWSAGEFLGPLPRRGA